MKVELKTKLLAVAQMEYVNSKSIEMLEEMKKNNIKISINDVNFLLNEEFKNLAIAAGVLTVKPKANGIKSRMLRLWIRSENGLIDEAFARVINEKIKKFEEETAQLNEELYATTGYRIKIVLQKAKPNGKGGEEK